MMKHESKGENKSHERVNAATKVDEDHRTIDEVTDPTFLEETSVEFTHPIEEEAKEDGLQHIYGWIALALAVLSFFFLPVLFSIAAIVIGIIARNRQSLALGYSAIVIGAISLLFYMMLPALM